MQLQDGVEALTESFDRLDTRVASVGQTAVKIGDHLEVLHKYPSMEAHITSCGVFSCTDITEQITRCY